MTSTIIQNAICTDQSSLWELNHVPFVFNLAFWFLVVYLQRKLPERK